MDEAKLHETRLWLIKADHDLRSAERLLTGDYPLLDTAVYHCQQAAEKALKSYLTLKEIRAFRYPGEMLEPTPEDAEEAYRLAEEIFTFIVGKLPTAATLTANGQ